MPQLTQIVPEHDYPHVMVVEHDNSARPNDKLEAPLETYCNMMCIFVSPKGIDRKFQTIDRGFKGFKEAYGIGSYDVYGQPYLNAYAAAKTDAATLHCMRLTADDATFSMGALVAHYKTTPAVTAPPPAPEIVAESEVLNLMGRKGIAAGDTLDTDPATVTVGGIDIEPGISADNADIFGTVKGQYIDATLDLEKMCGITFEDDVTYKVVQFNPALAEYVGKDQFVKYSEVTNRYMKEKTYTGAALKEGYAILMGTDSDITGYVIKMTMYDPADEDVVRLTNTSDLGIDTPSNTVMGNVVATAKGYVCNLGGEMKKKSVMNPELWGDISAFDDCWEVSFKLPKLDPTKKYVIIQTNPFLENYAADPAVKQVNGAWIKQKEYDGADLANDSFSILLGGPPAKDPTTGSTIPVQIAVYDADNFVSDQSPTLYTIKANNLVTYVDEYKAPDPPYPVEVEGTRKNFFVDAAITFTGETSSAALLHAQDAYNTLMKAATDKYLEENPPEPFEPSEGSLEIYYTFEAPEIAPRERDMLGELVTVDEETVDEEGYKSLKIFEMVCRGRGTYGDNVRWMLKNYPRGDKLSNYKNYWMNIYEIEDATLYLKETFDVGFIPDSLNADGESLFADYIMGDPFNNSSYVDIKTNHLAIRTLYGEYLKAAPDTGVTYNEFDPLLGMVYGSSLKKLPYMSIDSTREGAIAVAGASGVSLIGGSNGSFEADYPGREGLINKAYLKAWTGEIDRNIFSRKLYPTDIILDANYTYPIKRAIADLTHQRKDCITFYDLGTEFNSYNGMLEELAELEPDVYTRDEAIEAYWGKIQDPVTYKIIKVTSTYPLASMYPNHFREQGAKHVALAGSAYGVIQGYISGSPQLVFDDDLDSVQMDEMTELRINYLKVNSLKQIVRGTQTTRQDLDTNLSECSNVFVLHDIRRDCIIMCEGFEYNFLELSELQRFNKSAEIVAAKYAAAQVRSISATFDVNEWEYDRGILHLYVEFVHKNLVKRAIVEIDINRGRLMD